MCMHDVRTRQTDWAFLNSSLTIIKCSLLYLLQDEALFMGGRGQAKLDRFLGAKQSQIAADREALNSPCSARLHSIQPSHIDARPPSLTSSLVLYCLDKSYSDSLRDSTDSDSSDEAEPCCGFQIKCIANMLLA